MFLLTLIILRWFTFGGTNPIYSTENALKGPQEVQHAVCQISTKDIDATAKATITRQLRGVCSTNDMAQKFDLLHQELLLIKEALGVNGKALKLKSLGVAVATEYPDYSDSEEVSVYNDTIVQSSEGELYFYYWKINGISKVLMKRNLYISSETFSVLGHMLHLQFYPNYQEEFIGILLKPESNSFLKKHKISFLGQKNTKNEISSKKLYGLKNEDKIFKIAPQMLTPDFISNDSLLIRVKIYLEG
ncbi:uncharacterized protein LOC126736063 [Anthonomus grandis grandis]|uniref:uncharacterized protein LOC126736063 n=1 Tax=Anthonomus grandis grandis TaxID=2921223 RepID=UPI0021662FF9|nr:uncharacterized protein LOC126736063 [Anthonomus grandis grandis]